MARTTVHLSLATFASPNTAKEMALNTMQFMFSQVSAAVEQRLQATHPALSILNCDDYSPWSLQW